MKVAMAFIGTAVNAQTWRWTKKGAGGSANDYGSGIAIDGRGNSYVTGGLALQLLLAVLRLRIILL